MPRLLLHVCCGPCSLMPIVHFRDEGWVITAFFFNPNIQPADEWLRRRDAMREVALKLRVELLEEGEPVDPVAWVKALNGDLLCGRRCLQCYRPRMLRAAELAAYGGWDAFCSSLLYSKYQNHEGIIQEAEAASFRYGIRFEYRDFRPFWWDGIKMSKELGIYRQKWCGCVLSRHEAEVQRREAEERKVRQKAERAARLAEAAEQRRLKREVIAAKKKRRNSQPGTARATNSSVTHMISGTGRTVN